MTTSGIAFLSQAGIVMASDSDYSIRALSKTFPGVIAMDIHSPIPWKSIIDDYLLEDDSRSFSTLEEAYDNFSAFFKSRNVPSSMLKQDGICYVLFVGYNAKDIYPSSILSVVEGGENSSLEFGDSLFREVSHTDPAFFNVIGRTSYVDPILVGTTDSVMEAAQKIDAKLLSEYRDNLLKVIEEKRMDKKWADQLKGVDLEEKVKNSISDSIMDTCDDVAVGIDTLSIQEMISYAETLLNAETLLHNLKHKENRKLYGTREIATLTIPEGLTWIKHHLFAI